MLYNFTFKEKEELGSPGIKFQIWSKQPFFHFPHIKYVGAQVQTLQTIS